MNLLNFNIGDDFISLLKDGRYLDLHNNYDFVGYKEDDEGRTFKVFFEKSKEEWATDEFYNGLNLLFWGVSFLKIQEGDPYEYADGNKCIDVIGFSSKSIRDDMSLFTNEFDSESDMIFLFTSGHVIKIHAEEISLETY
jgi:hypothetical protein